MTAMPRAREHLLDGVRPEDGSGFITRCACEWRSRRAPGIPRSLGGPLDQLEARRLEMMAPRGRAVLEPASLGGRHPVPVAIAAIAV